MKVSDHAPSKKEKTTSRYLRNRVTEHTPIKKSMQSGEHHQQAMSDQERVITGQYKPSEEVASISRIDKSYLIKSKPL